MSLTLKVDRSKDLTTFLGIGEITFEDVHISLRAFYDSKPTMNVLWDLQNATISPLSASDIQNIVQIIKTFMGDFKSRRGGKTAFLVSKDVDFGLAKIFEGYTQNLPFKTMITRSREEATDWLDEGVGASP